jgi:quinol-cytochrome oxidoreductase complex cytochrome b subunit
MTHVSLTMVFSANASARAGVSKMLPLTFAPITSPTHNVSMVRPERGARLVRVFYTGAYKPPREFNWIVGVGLLLLTLGASFTGYLLPWDQLSFWAITVGTNIAGYAPVVGTTMREMLLGGADVGQNALIRFYTLHVAILPLVIALVISLHLWRVRKDGGLAANETDK